MFTLPDDPSDLQSQAVVQAYSDDEALPIGLYELLIIKDPNEGTKWVGRMEEITHPGYGLATVHIRLLGELDERFGLCPLRKRPTPGSLVSRLGHFPGATRLRREWGC